MAKYINRTLAPIHVGGAMLIPGIPTEVEDADVAHRNFESHLKARFIEKEEAAETGDQRSAREQAEKLAAADALKAEEAAAKAARAAKPA